MMKGVFPFRGLLLFAMLAGAVAPAPASSASRKPGDTEPAEAAERLYAKRVRFFVQAVPRLTRAVETLPASDRGTVALRREVDRLREAYKRMEFLVEYVHPGSAALLFPPPLERADMNAPHSTEVIPPEGLQTLQELAHADDPWPEREELHRLAVRLEIAARELEENLAPGMLDDRMLFEAMQSQVLRVMTQGVTGFDAPDVERALPESRLSLEAVRPVISLYLPGLRQREAALARRLHSALNASIDRLRNGGDFNEFDRLDFILAAGNPLYAALIDAQHALDIATFEDFGSHLRRPVSSTARNLFAPDFLDPHYYAQTPGEKMDTAVAALGRRLFFDPILSRDKNQSCATCHDPGLAFTDGKAKGPAFDGGILQRNAPSLTHAAWQGAQFWDLRVETLEEQIQQVIEGLDEFNVPLLEVVGRLRGHPEYPGLFRAAFPGDGEPVGIQPLAKALSMYLRSLGGWDSPFDRYARGETEQFDPAARRGFNLFMGKALCATCHFPPAFNGLVPPFYLETESEVLGVPKKFPASIPELDDDPGRIHFHAARIFLRAFKTPTVRNAELTGPYMHNGGMETLEAVMDFYNAGGGLGLGLDVPNQTLPPDSLGLSRAEMDDIIAFMNSLTDTTGFGAQGGGRRDE